MTGRCEEHRLQICDNDKTISTRMKTILTRGLFIPTYINLCFVRTLLINIYNLNDETTFTG